MSSHVLYVLYGIKLVFTDNDCKLHQKHVKDAWAEFVIKLYPGSGQRCWDRMEGGFPVDFPILMPLDRTIHHRWKTRKKEACTPNLMHENLNERQLEGS